MPTRPVRLADPKKTVRALADALGLEGRRVKSIDIQANSTKFSVVTAVWLIGEDEVDRVQKAVADLHASTY